MRPATLPRRRASSSAVGAGVAAGRDESYSLVASGNGFGEEVLTPPLRTSRFSVSSGDVFTATVALT